MVIQAGTFSDSLHLTAVLVKAGVGAPGAEAAHQGPNGNASLYRSPFRHQLWRSLARHSWLQGVIWSIRLARAWLSQASGLRPEVI